MRQNKESYVPYFLFIFAIFVVNLLFLLYSQSVEAFSKPHSGIVEIKNGTQHGSGFVIDKHIVVTNAHVCMINYHDFIIGKAPILLQDYLITTNNGLEIIGRDPKILINTDLCVIKIEQFVSSLLIDYNYVPNNGEFLLVNAPNKYGSVNGVYAGEDKTKDEYTKIHNNSHVILGKGKHGMSGSPILNSKGLVIGVFWGISLQSDVIYYISIDELKKLLEYK